MINDYLNLILNCKILTKYCCKKIIVIIKLIFIKIMVMLAIILVSK